jgi:photosystem II stability/assembly factor-like uncharacterized protein
MQASSLSSPTGFNGGLASNVRTTVVNAWRRCLWLAAFAGLLAACSDSSYIAAPVAPTITRQPADIVANEGQAVSFSVAADGTGPLVYQWHRSGTPISGASGATYSLPAVAMPDHGASFSVVVSNSAGSVSSASATLTVNPVAQAPAITAQPAGATVTIGQMATFAVTASGSAPLTYQWQRNGNAIAGATAASYTTPPATLADSGSVFRVVVANASGTVTSAEATLTVSGGAPQPPAGLVCQTAPSVAQCWAHPRPQGDGLNDVDFRDASNGIAATSNTLLRTTDGGVTWTIVADASQFDTAFVSVRFATPMIAVVVGGNGGIARTVDGGLTWTAVSSGTTKHLRAVRFASTTVGVAVGQDVILRTTDGGATWTAVSSALENWEDVAASGSNFVAVGGTNGVAGRFALSTDGGATWSAANIGSTAAFFGVAFVPTSTTVIAVGASGAMRRSLDGGATWAAAASGSSGFLRSIAFADANTGLVVGNAKALRTTNGGATWAEVEDGTSQSLATVAWRTATDAIALGESGVQRISADGGATWTGFTPVSVEDFAAGAFNGVSTVLAADVTGAIARSTDGGVTWSANPAGVSAFPNGMTFVDANTVLTVGDGGTISRSTDAGVTWTSVTSGTGADLLAVAMGSTAVGAAVGETGTLLRTTDGGASWSAVSSGTNADLYSVRFASPQVAVAVGDGVMLRTTDGGATWAAVAVPAVSGMVVRFASPTVGVIGGSTQSLRTTDGGASWTLINHPIGFTDMRRFEFTGATTGRGVMQNPAGALSVVTTVDGGATWAATAPIGPAFQSGFESLIAPSHASVLGLGQAGQLIHLTLP